MKEYELKKILNGLIAHAYAEDPLQKQYRRFWIEFYPNKALKSKHADYYSPERRIRIFNMYRTTESLTVTVLHELAHHIEYCRTGQTGHQAGFYRAYRELLYAAFDTGLISPVLAKEHAHADSRDHRKVLMIIDGYRPQKKETVNANVVLLAEPGFSRKDLVKERGYHYNAANRKWEKEFSPEEAGEEKSWLSGSAIPYEERPASVIDLRTGVWIYAASRGARGKNWTYHYRERLKGYGFHFLKREGGGVWRKEMTDSREIERYQRAMPELYFVTGQM